MFKRYVYTEGPTSLLGSGNKYFIFISGMIIDKDGNPLPVQKDSNGHKTVTCQGWDGYREYRVIDLMALQFKELRIPKEDYDKVIAFCCDSNSDNTHAKNIGYRFKDNLLEHREHHGFYYVPGYPKLIINKLGFTLNLHTNSIVPYFTTKPIESKNIKGGYLASKLSMFGGPISILQHRLLGLTFLDFPNNIDSLVINHKDSNGGNNDIKNIEWVTRAQNNEHAWDNGLRSQNTPVLARNVRTGEITEFRSINNCAVKLGYPTDETIRFRLNKCKFSQVFQDGYQFKFKDDFRDWIIPDDVEKAILDNTQAKKVIVKDCSDGKICILNTITEAADYTGVSGITIGLRLSTSSLLPVKCFIFKSDTDTRDFPDYLLDSCNKVIIPGTIYYDVMNYWSGETRKYTTCNDIKRILLIDVGPLKEGRQVISKDGWRVKQCNQDWEVIDDIDKTFYEAQYDVMAKNIKTGQIVLASNCAEMADILGLTKRSIRRHALNRGNSIHNGYRFRLGHTNEPWPETVI